MEGQLFIVGTPIGNLADITIRAIDTLKQVDLIAAEDTRVTKKLLNFYNIPTPLFSYREHNKEKAIPVLLDRIKTGESIALVTDAGTPSISDPGCELVNRAFEENIKVSPIPGPSAVTAALSVAGIFSDGFRFWGFLPRKGKERREKLMSIAADSSCSVIYESPHRLEKTLNDLKEACGSRKALVAREVTKLHEDITLDTLENLTIKYKGQNKGEITIVIWGNSQTQGSTLTEDNLKDTLMELLSKGNSVKEASSYLAVATGLPRKQIYDLAVTLKNND